MHRPIFPLSAGASFITIEKVHTVHLTEADYARWHASKRTVSPPRARECSPACANEIALLLYAEAGKNEPAASLKKPEESAGERKNYHNRREHESRNHGHCAYGARRRLY